MHNQCRCVRRSGSLLTETVFGFLLSVIFSDGLSMEGAARLWAVMPICRWFAGFAISGSAISGAVSVLGITDDDVTFVS